MMRSLLIVAAATGILFGLTATAFAQTGTFRDDFNAFHDYHAGTVPVGGIWTGVHNATNGDAVGGVPQAIFQSHGVDGFGMPKPDVLFIEDLNGGPTGTGMGWEGARTTGPLLFRDVPSTEDFDVKMKINAQTSGQWSSAGVLARRKGPPVNLAPPDPAENFVSAYSFRTDGAMPQNGTMLTKHIENGAQVVDNNTAFGGGPGADPEPLPVFVRMTKVGDVFTTLSSLNGAAWFTETVVTAPNIAAAGGTIEVGLTFQMFGGGQGTTEIDWFELVVGPVPPTDFTWAPTGAGNWATVTNWQTNSTPGAPNGNTHTVRFEGAITAPSTVFTDASVTAKRLVFNNANKYALAGTGTLTLAADTGNAAIDVTLGSHEIQTAVTLGSNLTVTTVTGTRLDINNKLNLNTRTINISGGGVVSINNNLPTGTGGSITNTGTLQGTGTVNGNLINGGGTVAPGNSAGTLTVTGNYAQTAGSTMLFELGGTGAGQFDKLVVGGNLNAAGNLTVQLINGFTPAGGNSFDIHDWGGTRSGTLTLNLPSLSPGLAWNTANLMTTGVLSVSSAAGDADFDNDGDVDGGDFLTWQRNLGQTGATNAQGDADGNGTVNGADLTVWKGTFGGAVAVAGAVPEPGACALIAMACAVLAKRSKKRRVRVQGRSWIPGG